MAAVQASLSVSQFSGLKALPQKANGVSHAAAGSSGAQESELFTKTNDPAGFTLADTLGWGALGHAFGFALLAVANNGYQFL
ncbi:unnamed protein product [Closterium sp. NIES-64]|nr:unnamed protein product [Closterium sp. NIES-64]